MFSEPISRRRALMLLLVFSICLVVSHVSFAGGERYKPRSEEHWPSNLVRAVQTQLKALGFNPGPIDGIYGPKTQNAIMEFQHAKDLKVDGKISNKLIGELGLG